MNLLLDTCAFLWLSGKVSELSHRARSAIENPANDIYLSAATIFEIGILNSFKPMSRKYNVAKLLSVAPAVYGLIKLDVAVDAAERLSRLPSIHKDPFDRLLICQAIHHNLTIVTPDEDIHRYPVRYLW